MSNYTDKAGEVYCQGFNCAQALMAAFAPVSGMDESRALRLASSFGGGMGNLKEVCGALTGAFMVLGLVHGFDQASRDNKRAHAVRVDAVAEAFRDRFGTIFCRDLLQRNIDDGTAETEVKPCLKFVVAAAEILERSL